MNRKRTISSGRAALEKLKEIASGGFRNLNEDDARMVAGMACLLRDVIQPKETSQWLEVAHDMENQKSVAQAAGNPTLHAHDG